MNLSIIIPVWNEEKKIEQDIMVLDTFFQNDHGSTEVIIVDDGSTDKTKQVVKNVSARISLVTRLISLNHFGKGKAVREGILAAGGRQIMYMDSGGNVPPKFILDGLELLKNDSDIAMASRKLKASKIIKSQIWYRKLISFLFVITTHIFLKLPDGLSDSQCGFKLFKADVAHELFSQARLDGFLFDLEVILLAKTKGYKITEFPIEWKNDRDSRFSILKSFKQILKDLVYLKKISKLK